MPRHGKWNRRRMNQAARQTYHRPSRIRLRLGNVLTSHHAWMRQERSGARGTTLPSTATCPIVEGQRPQIRRTVRQGSGHPDIAPLSPA